MEKGFFGTYSLLAGIATVLLVASVSASIAPERRQASEAQMLLEEANLRRSIAESYLDRAISEELFKSAALTKNSAAIKAAVDARIISAFAELGIGAKICSEKNGETQEEGELGAQEIALITKAEVIGAEPTIAAYTITGGQGKKIFPCAKIISENYSIYLRIPIGYFAEEFV
ncbi:MAG: hypothetical protein NUV67_01335 [archaeon]|nr:hypothetical protein [archaeon]